MTRGVLPCCVTISPSSNPPNTAMCSKVIPDTRSERLQALPIPILVNPATTY